MSFINPITDEELNLKIAKLRKELADLELEQLQRSYRRQSNLYNNLQSINGTFERKCLHKQDPSGKLTIDGIACPCKQCSTTSTI